MNQTSKRLFTCVIALIVCLHFVLVGVYCFPQNKSNSKIDLISRLYVYPVFQQNWGLFVPAPNIERKLFVRYKTDHGFTSWEDILSKEIVRHKTNRVLGNEARVLLLSNSLIFELNSLGGKPSSVFKSAINSKEFKVLEFEIINYLKSEYRPEIHTEYELLLISSGKENSRAYYVKNLSFNWII